MKIHGQFHVIGLVAMVSACAAVCLQCVLYVGWRCSAWSALARLLALRGRCMSCSMLLLPWSSLARPVAFCLQGRCSTLCVLTLQTSRVSQGESEYAQTSWVSLGNMIGGLVYT